MARLPYISRDDLPDDKRHIYDRITEARSQAHGGPWTGPYAVLLNSPDAADVVARVGEYIRFQCGLDPAVREIAILSTAREGGSQYEWTQHEPIARTAGVRDEVIESIRTGRAPMGLPAKEGVFAQAAREIVQRGALTERTFEAVLHLLGPQLTVDLIVLVGFYTMLGRAIASLGVELGPGVKPRLPETE